MTALVYVVVAASALSLAIEAFLADRSDPARQAFLAFASTLAVAYVAFALSLLPTLGGFRALYLLAGTATAPAALWTIDRAFLRDDPQPTPWMRAVYLGTAIIAPLATITHVALYDTFPRMSWVGLLAGGFAMFGFGVALHRLWGAQEAAALRIDRTRMQYLFAVLAAAAALTAVEGAARQFGPSVEPMQLSLSSREYALQGAFPPFSTIFTGLGTYFLYHSVVMSRLLDITELFSRVTTVLLSATALVLVDGLTFLWVDTFDVSTVHSTSQVFLASLLFLAAYDPLRGRIALAANRIFGGRSIPLGDAVQELTALLPSIIDADTLVVGILDALHRSGRAPVVSVYVWDDRLDAFTCAGHRGHDERRPLRLVAVHPFTDRFSRGAPWYLRTGVRRRARHAPEQAEVLALMDAMNADLALPLTSGKTVLGWVLLRDEEWSDGYSAEEILKLQDMTKRASVVLSNVRGFEAIEEQKRLAALGEMSAGLAHEIRNPLAGVKGAAQFLQGEELDGDAQDMLQVIITETDRLNIVVSQFLDYARPFELALTSEDLNAVTQQSLTLLRAQGIPRGVKIAVALDPVLPRVMLDRARVSQVLLNLLQNALQAMPDGGELAVQTRTGRDRTSRPVVEVEVSDTGGGVPPEAVDKLFVPFFTTKQTGTGLGLPICRRIAEAHSGEIELHSVQGDGATLVLRLPLTA